MIDYHKFQECFKGQRESGKKGDAYKKCVSSHKGVERVTEGPFLKDAKPKHDLYNLSENTVVMELIESLLTMTGKSLLTVGDKW